MWYQRVCNLVLLASHIFFRVHMRVRGWGGVRKNMSGDYSTVSVSNGNVISVFGHAIIT